MPRRNRQLLVMSPDPSAWIAPCTNSRVYAGWPISRTRRCLRRHVRGTDCCSRIRETISFADNAPSRRRDDHTHVTTTAPAATITMAMSVPPTMHRLNEIAYFYAGTRTRRESIREGFGFNSAKHQTRDTQDRSGPKHFAATPLMGVTASKGIGSIDWPRASRD